MPPAAAKDITYILYDLKAQPQSTSLDTLLKILLYRELSKTRDLIKLFVINAKERPESEFKGVYALDTNIEEGALVEELVGLERGESELKEVLKMAVDELKQFFEEPGVISLQLILISDLSSFSSSPLNLSKVTDTIKNYEIYFYCLGPKIVPSQTLKTREDIKKWMDNLDVEKNQTLNAMLEIAKNTPHSVVCDYKVGVHLCQSYKNTKGMQLWQVPLNVGTILELPVHTARISKREPPFKLENTEKRVNYDREWSYQEDPSMIIDIVDTVTGVIRHDKFVAIQSDGKFKVAGPRSFQILGFIEKADVPEYFLQSDGSYFVSLQSDTSAASQHFHAALIEKMCEKNLYIFARRVYNKDNNPRFVALIPKVNLNGFILCNLPYADDVRFSYTEEDVKLAPKTTIDNNLAEFLDKLGKIQFGVNLAPCLMVHETCLKIIDKLEEKVIKDKCREREEDVPMEFEVLKSSWPVREIETPKNEVELNDFDDVDDFNFDD